MEIEKDSCIQVAKRLFNFAQMSTNVQQLLTTVPLSPIVLMLWDHSSVHVNLDSPAIVKLVKVSVEFVSRLACFEM